MAEESLLELAQRLVAQHTPCTHDGCDTRICFYDDNEWPCETARLCLAVLEMANALQSIKVNAKMFQETQTEMHPAHKEILRMFECAAIAALGQEAQT